MKFDTSIPLMHFLHTSFNKKLYDMNKKKVQKLLNRVDDVLKFTYKLNL